MLRCDHGEWHYADEDPAETCDDCWQRERFEEPPAPLYPLATCERCDAECEAYQSQGELLCAECVREQVAEVDGLMAPRPRPIASGAGVGADPSDEEAA